MQKNNIKKNTFELKEHNNVKVANMNETCGLVNNEMVLCADNLKCNNIVNNQGKCTSKEMFSLFNGPISTPLSTEKVNVRWF